MTRLRPAPRRRQPVAGLSGLSGARGGQGGRLRARSTPTSTSTPSRGARAPLREAIAREFTRRYGVTVVADEQVTVCCGSTEAMMSTMLAIVDPGDEVVIFEPFYENYGPDAILSGATPRFVTLPRAATGLAFDPDELAAAFNDKTQGDHHQHAEQPDRQGVHARGARDDRGALPQVGRASRSPTRSTSTSSTTATRTCRSRRSTGWPTARSRSTACRRPTA